MRLMKVQLIISVFVISLNSCNTLSLHIPQETSEGSCLPPLSNFSYQLNGHNERIFNNDPIVPQSPWIQQSTIPIVKTSGEFVQTFLNFTRTNDSYTEVWIIKLLKNEENNLVYILEVYNSSSNEWREILITLEEPIEEIIQIYLGDTGEIWARTSPKSGERYGYINGYTKIPFDFAVLIEEEGKFKRLDFLQDIPLGPVDFDGGRFWIFEENGPVYSLNPKSLEVEKYSDYRNAEISKVIHLPPNIIYSDNSLAFSKDGSFYFVNGTPKEYHTPNDMYLFRFSPEKNLFEAFPILLKNHPPLGNLFVDKAENLWISDYGWLDKHGVWHQIIRSPLFITMNVEGESVIWDNPQIILESTDGRLWFLSSNGMTWLDPEKGEWCWFTTYQSNIVEDADRNLWMIADGKLYKLPLGK